MDNSFIKVMLAFFAAIALFGCNNDLGSNNTTTNGSSSIINSLALQMILNNTVNSEEAKNEYITGIPLTFQCNGFNDNQPVSLSAGKMSSKANSPDLPINAIYQIGSSTKSFIAVVALQLEAQGYFGNNGLDSTIGEVLGNPVSSSTWNASWNQISLRRLLNMTSGIPDYTNYSLEEYAKNPEYYFSSDELIQTVVDKPATFSPGEGWHYSNTNYVIMNKIISYVTNSTIKEQITTRIINKLGLDHTYYVENLSLNAITDVTQKSLLMSGYYGIKESGLFPPGTDVSLYSLSYFNAAGSIISDTLDMNKYMHALFSKKNGLLEPVQLKELTDMVATEDFNGHMAGQPITSVTEVSTKEGIGLGYGLGVMEFFIKLPDNRNFTMYSHGGTVFGFNSNWIYVPEKQAFISYVVNSYSKNRDTLKSLEAKLYEKIANNCTSTYMPDK